MSLDETANGPPANESFSNPSLVEELENVSTTRDISYYGTNYDSLNYFRFDEDDTDSLDSSISSEKYVDIVEPFEYRGSVYLHMDEEYQREIWGRMVHFQDLFGEIIKTGDELSFDDFIEEMKRRFREKCLTFPLKENLEILNFLLASAAHILTNIGIEDVLLHLGKATGTTIHESKTMELLLRYSIFIPNDDRRRILLLLVEHKTFIINIRLGITKDFLVTLLTGMRTFESTRDEEFNEEVLLKIREIYLEFMDNPEIIKGITSLDTVKELHNLLKEPKVRVLLQHCVIEILTIICSHYELASNALIQRGIDRTLCALNREYKFKVEAVKLPYISLIWALLPALPQSYMYRITDQMREETLMEDKMAIWRVEHEADEWVPFNPQLNYFIERSYREKKKEVCCYDFGIMTFNFTHMVLINEATSERMAISREEIVTYRVLNLKKTKKDCDFSLTTNKFIRFAFKLLTRRFSISTWRPEEYYCLEALLTLFVFMNQEQHRMLLFSLEPRKHVWRAAEMVKIMKTLLAQEQIYGKMFAIQILSVLSRQHSELYSEINRLYGIGELMRGLAQNTKFLANSDIDGEDLSLELKLAFWMRDQGREFLLHYKSCVDYPNFVGKSIGDGRLPIMETRDELEYYKRSFFDEEGSNVIMRRPEAIKYFLKYLTGPSTNTEKLERMRMFLEVFAGIPISPKLQHFEISRTIFRELVEKIRYFLIDHEGDKNHDFHKIYRTGIRSLRKLGARLIPITMYNKSMKRVKSMKVHPTTTIKYLEHFVFAQKPYSEYNGWSSSTNMSLKFKYQMSLKGFVVPSEMTVYEAIFTFGIDGKEVDIFHQEYEFLHEMIEVPYLLEDEDEDEKFVPRTRVLERYLRNRAPAGGNVYLTEDVKNALHLTDILYGFSKHWTSAYPTIKHQQPLIDPQHFVNMSVDALLTSRLMDPFAAFFGKLPPWVKYMVDNCPFILSLETRKFAFRVLSLDRIRALMTVLSKFDDYGRWITYNDKNSKLIVKRDSILYDVNKFFCHTNPAGLWKVQFEGEIGVGPGLRRELFTSIGKELQKAKYRIWSASETTNTGFVICDEGLYPQLSPHSHRVFHHGTLDCISVVEMFTTIGALLGKALMEENILVLPLASSMFKWLLNQECLLTIEDFKYVNPSLHKVLDGIQNLIIERDRILANADLGDEEKKCLIAKLRINGDRIESYDLDFSIPGYEGRELIPNGINISVTVHNAHIYLDKIRRHLLTYGVRYQFDAMKRGFNYVVGLDKIHMLQPEELQTLVCGEQDDDVCWSLQNLGRYVQLDYYKLEDADIQNLFTILSSASRETRRNFLEFVTGCPRLPVGGFEGLTLSLRITKIRGGYPTSQTCFNQLKLPQGMNQDTLLRFIEEIIPEALGYFGFA